MMALNNKLPPTSDFGGVGGWGGGGYPTGKQMVFFHLHLMNDSQSGPPHQNPAEDRHEGSGVGVEG